MNDAPLLKLTDVLRGSNGAALFDVLDKARCSAAMGSSLSGTFDTERAERRFAEHIVTTMRNIINQRIDELYRAIGMNMVDGKNELAIEQRGRVEKLRAVDAFLKNL